MTSNSIYSGSAAIDHSRKEFVIDNVTTGFSLHQFGREDSVREYELKRKPSRHVPKQVAFAEDGKVVIGGSECGKVYVFDRESGGIIAMLHHGKGGMVQTITVSRRMKFLCLSLTWILGAGPARGYYYRERIIQQLWTE
jgi:hypothetical protein